MTPTRSRAIQEALRTFVEADRARRNAIEHLLQMGAIRSRVAVADLGEAYAAAYYGVDLAPKGTPGYDLRVRRRRVQVKTLWCIERIRRIIGPLKEPYDILFAIRLDENCMPLEAIEVPRRVINDHLPRGGRLSWTLAMENDPRARRISADELMPRKHRLQ